MTTQPEQVLENSLVAQLVGSNNPFSVLTPAPEKQRRAMAELCPNPDNPVHPVEKGSVPRTPLEPSRLRGENLSLMKYASEASRTGAQTGSRPCF